MGLRKGRTIGTILLPLREKGSAWRQRGSGAGSRRARGPSLQFSRSLARPAAVVVLSHSALAMSVLLVETLVSAPAEVK